MTVKVGKEAFYNQYEMNLSDAYTYTSKVMTKNSLTDDAKEGITSFLEKREPIWKDN
jgi:enoyl-CoA hydratase/carnithine racemase